MKTETMLASTGETIEYAKIYIEQKIDYLQLEIAKRTAKTTSNLLTIAVIAFFSFMIIFFLSITAGFALSSLVGSYTYGFLIVSAIYLLITLIVVFFKRKIITNPITELIIENMLD